MSNSAQAEPQTMPCPGPLLLFAWGNSQKYERVGKNCTTLQSPNVPNKIAIQTSIYTYRCSKAIRPESTIWVARKMTIRDSREDENNGRVVTISWRDFNPNQQWLLFAQSRVTSRYICTKRREWRLSDVDPMQTCRDMVNWPVTLLLGRRVLFPVI